MHVRAKTERGFYRAGLHFTREGVELDPKALKKEQLEAIEAEPNLIVTQPKPADEKQAKGKKAD